MKFSIAAIALALSTTTTVSAFSVKSTSSRLAPLRVATSSEEATNVAEDDGEKAVVSKN